MIFYGAVIYLITQNKKWIKTTLNICMMLNHHLIRFVFLYIFQSEAQRTMKADPNVTTQNKPEGEPPYDPNVKIVEEHHATMKLANQLFAKLTHNLANIDLQELCAFLKQIRDIVKPPLSDLKIKQKFCKFFDSALIHRSIDEINRFIKQQRSRRKSQLRTNNHKTCQKCQQQQEEKQLRSSCPSVMTQSHESTQPCPHGPADISVLIDKLILYTWQLINIRTIFSTDSASLLNLPHEIVSMFHRVCISTSRVYVSKWGLRRVTMQAMQIAYFNLLKNKIFDVHPERNGSLCCLIEAVLGDTQEEQQNDHHQFVNLDKEFDKQEYHKEYETKQTVSHNKPIHENNHMASLNTNNHQHNSEKSPKKDHQNKSPHKIKNLNKKTSTELQLQWFTYIIQYCMAQNDSFLRESFIQLSNGNLHLMTHTAISFLHFVSVLLNKIVNDRTTTQIVNGYRCDVQEVRLMYNSGNKDQGKTGNFLHMKIGWSDYQWLIEVLLVQAMRKYKSELKAVWNHHMILKQTNPNKHTSDHSYMYCIMNIISILNCCLFLGGYSSQLQKRTTKLVMIHALQFLQISYLIYELCHAKPKKITIKSNQQSMLKALINNLESLIKVEREAQEDQIKIPSQQDTNIEQAALRDILPLQQGQLVSIIRLLSNLVHINQQAQKYFEDNMKYFRIVMSLTHEFQSQLTMKNWAIVFLKNVAERSQIMREELERLQIDVKVDQGQSEVKVDRHHQEEIHTQEQEAQNKAKYKQQQQQL